MEYEKERHIEKVQKKVRKVIFLKGSAEKVLLNCDKNSYPADAF